jgi:hypothetical protein
MRPVPILLILLALAGPAVARDGVLEINQTCAAETGCFAGDTPGFPITITAPGSYVLTSDLTVGAETDALVLAADDITLDLNGFAIRGPSTCVAGLCPIGEGDGISRPGGAMAPGNRANVSFGTVSGFTGTCLSLGTDSAVTGVLVRNCGFRGINVTQRSLVTGNRVLLTGLEGIALGDGSAFSNNVVTNTGMGGGGNAAILGGAATAGNICDDGSCSSVPRRRFYLTLGTFNGAQADEPGTCAPGFHFASLWEILDPSQLKYDTALGLTNSDSGSGPPDSRGWIRSGGSGPNCSNWTSSTFGTAGGVVGLPSQFDWLDPGELISPWRGGGGGVGNCSGPFSV